MVLWFTYYREQQIYGNSICMLDTLLYYVLGLYNTLFSVLLQRTAFLGNVHSK